MSTHDFDCRHSLADAARRPLAVILIGGSFGLLMAGAVISILPMMIMFLLFQKQIIKGIVLEGIKE